MEVLRIPPYPITTTWDVPEPNIQYRIEVEDVVDHTIEDTLVTSSSNSQVNYILPRSKVQYDRDFAFRIYDNLDNIVVDSNLTVYRPYVDPNILASTASEINEYKRLEIIARSIIDAYLQNDSGTGEGFYNHKLIIQGVGDGTDYYPVWHNPKKILRVYENNVLVYSGEDLAVAIAAQTPSVASNNVATITTGADHGFSQGDTVTISNVTPESYNGTYTVASVPASNQFSILVTDSSPITGAGSVKRTWPIQFVITPNNSAIMRYTVGEFNRYEARPMALPIGTGDLNYWGYDSVGFPKGYDYTFILDVGYKAVPPDVEQAAMMLIDDLKQGRNDYYRRFVTEYSTDQFDVKFSSSFLRGTGNNIVDKILDGYKGDVIKPGIL
jgi:hypothetical protein